MVPRGIQVCPCLQQAPDVLQQVHLRQGPGCLYAVLGDACRAVGSELVPHPHPPWASLAAGGAAHTSVGHGCLKTVQRLLVFTQVIGHVPICVDRQEVSTPAGKVGGVWPQDSSYLLPPERPPAPSQSRAALQDTGRLPQKKPRPQMLLGEAAPQPWVPSQAR